MQTGESYMRKAILLLLAAGCVSAVGWRAYQLYRGKRGGSRQSIPFSNSGGRGGGPLPTMRVPLVDSVCSRRAMIEDRVCSSAGLRPLEKCR